MIFGLTGGIGSGKTTVSRMAREMGALVWDADAETHNLYRYDLSMIGFIHNNFPEALDRNMNIDRKILGQIVFSDMAALDLLSEKVGHLLAQSLESFVSRHQYGETPLILDVPLLFEYGMETQCDAVIVVYCPPDIQRERVLARGTTQERLDQILALQWSNEQRFAKAHHTVDTNRSREEVRAEVERIILARPQTISEAGA